MQYRSDADSNMASQHNNVYKIQTSPHPNPLPGGEGAYSLQAMRQELKVYVFSPFSLWEKVGMRG